MLNFIFLGSCCVVFSSGSVFWFLCIYPELDCFILILVKKISFIYIYNFFRLFILMIFFPFCLFVFCFFFIIIIIFCFIILLFCYFFVILSYFILFFFLLLFSVFSCPLSFLFFF